MVRERRATAAERSEAGGSRQVVSLRVIAVHGSEVPNQVQDQELETMTLIVSMQYENKIVMAADGTLGDHFTDFLSWFFSLVRFSR